VRPNPNMTTAIAPYSKRGAGLLLAFWLAMPFDAQAQLRSGDQAPPLHQLSLYVPFGADLYLSNNRTLGGLGGGLGVRDTVQDRFLLQAELDYLMGLRNAGMFRLGAGVQRQGLYAPAAMLVLSGLFGEGFNFLTPQHPSQITFPAMALGLSVAPARFVLSGTQVSLLEVGIGIGSDLPGVGVHYHLRLLEVAASF